MANTNNSGANSGSILKAPENLTNPRDYKAPSSDNAQSRGAVNVIQKLSKDQTYCETGQGQADWGPSVWGGSTDDKAKQSSADAGTKVSDSNSVNFTTGQNSCWNGGNRK